MAPDSYCSAMTASVETGLTERTIRQYIHDGTLPSVRFPGRRVAIPRAAVEELKRQREQLAAIA